MIKQGVSEMNIPCLGNVLDKVAPHPTELWERGGATIETQSIDGRSVDVPIFYKSHLKPFEDGVFEEIHYKGEHIGSRVHYRIEMSTGISRDVVVYLPLPEKLEQASVTIHMDTPWMTGAEGHNDKIAEAFMQHTGQPVIMVGPENMNQHKSGLYVVKNLAKVATEASQVSLALAGQDSMQIVAALCGQLGLPRKLIQVGESRAAMMAGAKQPHEAELGLETVYNDITDPCISENIRNDLSNVVRLPLFVPIEAMNLLPVGVDLARRGSLHREKGTVPMSARYMAAAILGTGPAIFSGEAGEFPAFLSKSDAVHLVNFQYNHVAHHEKWREKYAHTQFAGVNLKGAHLGLAYSSVQRHVIERINRYIEELNAKGGDSNVVDFKRVHLTDDQSTLGKHEHMPEVA